jgi:hypothetical protein
VSRRTADGRRFCPSVAAMTPRHSSPSLPTRRVKSPEVAACASQSLWLESVLVKLKPARHSSPSRRSGWTSSPPDARSRDAAEGAATAVRAPECRELDPLVVEDKPRPDDALASEAHVLAEALRTAVAWRRRGRAPLLPNLAEAGRAGLSRGLYVRWTPRQGVREYFAREMTGRQSAR